MDKLEIRIAYLEGQVGMLVDILSDKIKDYEEYANFKKFEETKC